MPREAFLVNPPRRIKRKTTAKHKSTKRKLPSGFSRSKAKRITVYKTGERLYARSPFSPSKQAGISVNPYGEEVIVVGKNPRRRKRRSAKRRVVRRKRRNPIASTRRTKRVYRKRRNPVARVSRKRSNPVARRRRTYRRNPAMALSVGSLNFKKPMTLIVPIATGIASTIATRKVPDMLNLFGWQRTGAQVAVALVGGIILKKPLGMQNAAIWTVVSLVNTAGELLRDKIGGVFAGYSAFVDRQIPFSGGMMSEYTDAGMYGAFVDRESEYAGDTDEY